MKIFNASNEIPGMNSKDNVESFLGSRLNLQLATIDENGYPNIQPVWFYHDNDKNRFYILTSSTAKKILNIRNNSKVYFSVDESNTPYKGVMLIATRSSLMMMNRLINCDSHERQTSSSNQQGNCGHSVKDLLCIHSHILQPQSTQVILKVLTA